jgi:hypothetical protein
LAKNNGRLPYKQDRTHLFADSSQQKAQKVSIYLSAYFANAYTLRSEAG